MSLKQTLEHFLTCPNCLQEYDNRLRSPRYIPCTNAHYTCTKCAHQLLLQNTGCCRCPFDLEKLDLNNKNISDFSECEALQKLLKDLRGLEFCRTHDMQLICVECGSAICKKCEAQDHQRHQIEDSNGIWGKIYAKFFRISQCIMSFDRLIHSRVNYIEEGNEIIETLERKLASCITELNQKGTELIRETKLYFENLKKVDLLIGGGEDVSVWRNKANDELKQLDLRAWTTKDVNSIPYVLFNLEEELINIGAEARINKEQKDLNLILERGLANFNDGMLRAFGSIAVNYLGSHLAPGQTDPWLSRISLLV